jgi:hypothetical protein
VYEDGTVNASAGTFTGTIYATGGEIGNLKVDDLVKLGYEVVIESSLGNIFKNGQGTTTLTARLYKAQEEI